MTRIAVVGATGNTGSATVKALRSLGEKPLCVVRNVDKAREVLGADTKTAVAELTDRVALEKALQGADNALLVTGQNPQMFELESNVIDAALKAGTKYLVHVSAVRAVATRHSATLIGRSHFAVEEKLTTCGIGWVILRPNLFMQNMFGQVASIKNDSKIVLPFANDLPLALIDVRDTGAVGARILIDPAAHVGRTYEFTGALTTYAAFADDFSQVLGRKIAFVAVTPEEAGQAMKARNIPDWLVMHLVAIAKLGASGAFSTENTRPITEIVKRAPLTTRQFVEDHKSLFA
jgi:NAD(P)H dehydrogenase (quinone)